MYYNRHTKQQQTEKPLILGTGWWATHKFSKRSVMDVSHFCGWAELRRLIEKCETDIERALVATLFLTGSRATEILTLTCKQFTERTKSILIEGVTVLKQKEAANSYRQVLIWKTDQNQFLVEHMMKWVEHIGEGKLFWFKYDKLYKIIINIDKTWYPHRFRAERASQLATKTGIKTILLLMKWFGWTSEKMPAHYAKMSIDTLEDAFIVHERRTGSL